MFVTVYITVADYWKIKKNEILKFYSVAYLYEKFFNDFIMPEIGMMKILEITSSDLEKIVRKVYESGKSKSTVVMVCALLRKFFHQAAVDKLANENVLKNLKPIIRDRYEKRNFSPEQEKSLLLSFKFTKQPELYTLAMLTGIPYRNLAACSIDDYSSENKSLQITRKGNQYYAKSRNSEANIWVISLSDISCRVIEFAIKKQNEKNKIFPGNESNLIFTNVDNTNFSQISKAEYKIIRTKSGIYDFLLKDLVSNFGIHALKYKINPTTLKHYFGNKSDAVINSMALSCHNHSKDIQANDEFYRSLKNE